MISTKDGQIFSRDQQNVTGDINDGGRALEAVLRPYATKIPGKPIEMLFDIQNKVFRFTFRMDPDLTAPLEIFVPEYQYPLGFLFDASDGKHEINEKSQTVLYFPYRGKELHFIKITSK